MTFLVVVACPAWLAQRRHSCSSLLCLSWWEDDIPGSCCPVGRCKDDLCRRLCPPSPTGMRTTFQVVVGWLGWLA